MAIRKAVLLAIGAIGAALVWGTPAVAAPTPTPTAHPGDVTTCEAAGLDGFVLATRERPPGDVAAPDASEPGALVDVDHTPGAGGGRRLDATVRAGYFMTGVVVVGGGSYHRYVAPAGDYLVGPETLTDLVAPSDSGGNPVISRYIVCGTQHLEPDATVHQGDVTTCEAVGAAGTIQAHGEAAPGDVAPDFGSPTTGAIVDVDHFSGPLQGREASLRVKRGYTMSAIVVAGAGAYNVYPGPFAGPVFISQLTAPAQGQDLPVIEHYFVCGSPDTTTTPPTTTAPAATTTPPALPDTGTGLTGQALLGLVSGGVVLVLGGLAILLVVRRRRA